MATIRAKGKRLYIRLTDSRRNPKEKWIPTHLPIGQEERAKRLLAKVVYEQEMGLKDYWEKDNEDNNGINTQITVAKELFLLTKAGHAAQTIRMYELVIRHLSEWADKHIRKNCKVSQITASHVSRFLSVHQNDKTKHTYWAHLRTFFNWAKQQGFITTVPKPDLPRGAGTSSNANPITLQQVQKIAETIKTYITEKSEQRVKGGFSTIREGELEYLPDLLMFSFCSGMRPSEIINLKGRHVEIWRDANGNITPNENGACGNIEVKNSNHFSTKDKRDRAIPINDVALEIILRRNVAYDDYLFTTRKNVQIDRTRASKLIGKFILLAGYSELNWYSCRHGFCTALAEENVSLQYIRYWAGHADFTTTQKYVRMNPRRDEERRKFFSVFRNVAGL